MSVKRAAARLLRRASLLSLADRCYYLANQMRTRGQRREFAARHPEFPTPPPRLAFEAFHNVDWDSYRNSGLHHARLVCSLT
jgi:hypothetical protein